MAFRGTAACGTTPRFFLFLVIYCIKKINIYESLHNCEEFLNEQALNFLCFLGGLRGASIIDSLDTLYIMELMDEYNDAKEWVKTSMDLNSVRKLFTPLPFFFYLQYYSVLDEF